MNTVLNETEYAVFTLCNPKDPVSGLVLASPCRLPRRLTWVDPDWGGGGGGAGGSDPPENHKWQ